MAMSKKDFIALADAVREHNANTMYTGYPGCMEAERFTERQLQTLASFCKRQNSDFKTDRWMGYIAGDNGKNGGAIKPEAQRSRR